MMLRAVIAFCLMAVTAFGVTDVDLGRLADFRAVEVSAGQWVFVTSVTPTPDPDVWPDDWPPYPYTVGRWEFATSTNVQPDTSYVGTNVLTVTGATYQSDTNTMSASFFFDETNDYMEKEQSAWNAGASNGFWAAWVKGTGLDSAERIMSYSDTATTRWHLSLNHRGAGTGYNVDSAEVAAVIDNVVHVVDTPVGSLPQDVWSHVVAVASNGTWKIYINGVPQTLAVKSGSNDGYWMSSITGADVFSVGCLRYTSRVQYFGGNISNPIVGNVVPTDEQVLDLYNREAYDGKGFPRYLMNTNDVLSYRLNELGTNAFGVWPFADINPDGSFPAKAQDWLGTAHGSPNDMASATVDGDNGVAVFNSTSSRIGFGDTLDPLTNDFSISLWVNASGSVSADSRYIWAKSYSTGSGNPRFFCGRVQTTGYLTAFIRDGVDTTGVSINDTRALPTNQWIMVTVTYDRDGMGTIYTNAVKAAEADISGEAGSIDVIGSFFLGCENFAGTIRRYWGGALDEAMYTKTVLSPSTVTNLYLDTKGMFGL